MLCTTRRVSMLQDKHDVLWEAPPKSLNIQEGTSESGTSAERALRSRKRSHNTLGSTAATPFQRRVLDLLSIVSRDTHVVSSERFRFSPFPSSRRGGASTFTSGRLSYVSQLRCKCDQHVVIYAGSIAIVHFQGISGQR
jgi:hypothetical protein